MHMGVVHELAALEDPHDPDEVQGVGRLDGVDIECVVFDARPRRYDHAAPVVASVADGDVDEPFYGERLMVVLGEHECGGEGFVVEVGSDGREGVRERSSCALEARGDGLRTSAAKPYGDDVHEVVVTHASEIHVRNCAAGNRYAGFV